MIITGTKPKTQMIRQHPKREGYYAHYLMHHSPLNRKACLFAIKTDKPFQTADTSKRQRKSTESSTEREREREPERERERDFYCSPALAMYISHANKAILNLIELYSERVKSVWERETERERERERKQVRE